MRKYRLPRIIAVSIGIVSAVAISACSTPSSEITKVGPDSYTISTSAPPIGGGSVEAKELALSQANEFCAKNGKDAFVTDFQTSKNHAEVNFRCEERGR